MEPFVSFIVPSLGRATLRATLDSIYAQSYGYNETIVVFDHAIMEQRSTPPKEFNTQFVYSTHHSAGLQRNVGILHARGKWVAFVDDDDILEPEYVSHLSEYIYHNKDTDVVITRMDHPQLGVLPDPIEPEISWGKVGISFAVRRDILWKEPFLDERSLSQEHEGNEDYKLLDALKAKGHKIGITSWVDYIVRPETS